MALRTKVVAPAPQVANQNALPLKPGKVIPWDSLTPEEKEHFSKMGLNDVPIPSNINEFISQYAAEATAITPEMLKELPQEPPKLEGQANIDDLPSEKQRDIREAINKATTFWANRENQLRYDSKLTAPVQEALSRVEDSPSVIVDDRKTAAPAQATEPVSIIGNTEVTTPEPGKMSDTGAVGLTHCPHCNFDLTLPSPSQPTDEQKLAFLVATLTNKPFEHEYTFLGDRAAVLFRTPTTKIADLVSTQLVHDTVSGHLISREAIMMRQQIYMMCVSIVKIKLPEAEYVLPKLSDVSDEPMPDGRKNSGGVAELHRYITEELLQSEPLRAALAHKYSVFAQTVGKLAARIDDTDFWNVTGPPG